MTRVDFYVLPDVDLEARLRFACRLAHRAVAAGQHVHVHAADSAACSDLDVLMWTYPDYRFLPHGVSGEATVRNAPVVIGHREPEAGVDQLLINLAMSIPPFFGRFELRINRFFMCRSMPNGSCSRHAEVGLPHHLNSVHQPVQAEVSLLGFIAKTRMNTGLDHWH